MELWEKIIEAYPEISPTDFFSDFGIYLRDDGDGIPYIEKWEYHKPLTEGLKVGKN